MNKYRTKYCAKITDKDIEKEVRVAGWIENIRDHGGVIFVDVRDESGVIQLVSNDDHIFDGLTKESTVTVNGKIRKRSEDDYNLKLKTGKLELLVDSIEVLGKAKHILPFEVITSHEVNEEVRLKYRYLDLRNPKVHDNIVFRSQVIDYLRSKMKDLGFLDIQTPILTVSSPEGARDYIVPSRKYHGKFYALPQAPQIFKQLLMVGGFDKYFQVAPCFRDEDARADRTAGEFYQLDFEMSFATEEDVYEIGEEIFYDTFKKFTDKEVSPRPFRRISYRESMEKYGTDKPDLRNPLEIIDFDVANEELMKDFLEATKNIYTNEKIFAFMESCFGNNNSLPIEEMPLNDMEAFICLIFATVKKDDENCFYEVELIDDKKIINNCFLVPHFLFTRKESI